LPPRGLIRQVVRPSVRNAGEASADDTEARNTPVRNTGSVGLRPVVTQASSAWHMRFTNPILMAMRRLPRADPSALRRPRHGQVRCLAALSHPGEVQAANDPTAATEWTHRPGLLPPRAAERRALPLAAPGVGLSRPRAHVYPPAPPGGRAHRSTPRLAPGAAGRPGAGLTPALPRD